jgi:hypothetical protein
VELGVLRRKNQGCFLFFFFGAPENMTLSAMVPHEASSEHSEGSSHLLDCTFGSRYGQSSLPKYVFASASLSLWIYDLSVALYCNYFKLCEIFIRFQPGWNPLATWTS